MPAPRKTSRLTLQEHALLLLLLGLLVLGSIVRYQRYRAQPAAPQPTPTEASSFQAGQPFP